MKKTPIILCAALCAFMPFAKITERNIFNSHKISAVAAVDNAEQQNEGAVTTQSNVTTFGPSINYYLRGLESVEDEGGNPKAFSSEFMATGILSNEDAAILTSTRITHKNATLKKVVVDYYTTSDATPTYMVEGTNVIEGLEAKSIGDGVNMYMSAAKDVLYILSSNEIVWNANMAYMFYDCTALESVEFKNINTSNVTNMGLMFAFDESLTSITGIADWDTSNVTDFNNMFRTNKVTHLDVANWDLSSAVDMNSIFAHCTKLKTFNEPTNGGWDVSSVTDLGWLFYNCQELPISEMNKLNVEDWEFKQSDFGKEMAGINLQAIFWQCFQVTSVQERTEANKTDLGLLDLSKWRAHSFDNISHIFGMNPQLTYVDISSWDDTAELNVTNMEYMFNNNATANDSQLTTVTLWETNPSKAENLHGLFNGCVRLTTINNLENWTLGAVKDMGSMFSNCLVLTSIDLSNFETPLLIDTSYMFYKCYALEEIILTDGEKIFETANVENFKFMFYSCENVAELDVSKFDTSSAINMYAMFYGCKKVTTLDVSNFNTRKVQDFGAMFSACVSLTSLDVGGFDTRNARNMASMFSNLNVTELDVSNFVTSYVSDMNNMFYACKNLTLLDVSRFDTSNVINMRNMFYGCQSLTSLNVSNFKTDKVTDMYAMFHTCKNIQALNVSNFNTENVKNMAYMFYVCSALEELDVSNFNTSQVTDMKYMFASCSGISELDISNFITDEVEDMHAMFYSCSSLQTLNIDPEKFNTEKVTNMGLMFANCINLMGLDVSGFETSACVSMDRMFLYCSMISKLDLTGFNMALVDDAQDMLKNATNLSLIVLPYNVQKDINLNTNKTLYLDNNPINEITSANCSTSSNKKVLGERYTISFVVTNGSTSVQNYYVDAMEEQEISLPTIAESSGYTYKAWTITTQPSNSNVKIENGKLIIPANTFGNITLKTEQIETMGTLIATWKDSLKAKYPDLDIKALTKVIFTKDASILPAGEGVVVSPDGGNYPVKAYINNNILYFYCEHDVYVTPSGMFHGFTGLTQIDLSTVNTSKATTFNTMFYQCENLEEIIGLDKLNTSKALSMNSMFYMCNKLKEIDLSNFDTSKVTDMYAMFHSCRALTELDVTNFRTSNVTNMGFMFFGCSSLVSLDLSKFDMAKVVEQENSTGGSYTLRDNMLNFQTSTTDPQFKELFLPYNVQEGVVIKIDPKLNLRTKEENPNETIYNSLSSITSINCSEDGHPIKAANVYNITYTIKSVSGTISSTYNYQYSSNSQSEYLPNSTDYTYKNYTVTKQPISNNVTADSTGIHIPAGTYGNFSVEVEKYENFGHLKNADFKTELGLRTNSTEKSFENNTVTEIIFTNDASKIEGLTGGIEYSNEYKKQYSSPVMIYPVNTDLDTDKPEKLIFYCEHEIVAPVSLGSMFFGFVNLKTIDFSNLKITSSTTKLGYMFYNCKSLTTIINFEEIKNAVPTDTTQMFYFCESLTTIDLAGLDTSNVTSMYAMFHSCINLQSLDISTFDTRKVTNMGSMFYGCQSLEGLYISNFDMSSVVDDASKNLQNLMFRNVFALKILELPKNVPNGLHIELPRSLYINFDLSGETLLEGTEVHANNLSVVVDGAEVGTYYKNTSTKVVYKCVSKTDSECVWVYAAYIGSATPSISKITSANCSEEGKVVRAENYFTISFDANGGIGGTTNKVVSVGFEVTDIEVPTRTGYTFEGYYLGEAKYFDANGKFVIKSIDEGSGEDVFVWLDEEDKTLIAKWTAKEYDIVITQPDKGTITISKDGEPVTNGKVTFGATYTVTITANTGYVLDYANVYFNNDDQKRLSNISSELTVTFTNEISEAIRISAYFNKKSYTITYNKDGGIGGGNETTVYYDTAVNQITTPIKEGYIFLGYYVGETQYFDADGDFIKSALWQEDNNVTVTAKWQKEVYNIVLEYEASMGTASVSLTTVSVGDIVNLTAIAKAPNYKFAKWVLEDPAQATLSRSTANESTLTIKDAGENNATIKLIANFALKASTVTFTNGEGATGGQTTLIIEYGTTVQDVSVPAQEGQTFLGYYDGKTKYFDVQGKYVKGTTWDYPWNINLTAMWATSSYAIEVLSNTAMGTASADKLTAVIGDVITLTYSENPGYRFTGWTISQPTEVVNENEGVYTLTIVGGEYSKITITANFEPKTYSVEFDDDGGENGADDLEVVYNTEGESVIISGVPYKEGYIFLGYYFEDEDVQYFDADGNFNLDRWEYSDAETITLKAHWQVEEYDVTVSHNDGGNATISINSEDLTTGKVEYGKEYVLTATANGGYKFKEFSVEGENCEIVTEEVGENTVYKLRVGAANVAQTIIVTATFEAEGYKIILHKNDGSEDKVEIDINYNDYIEDIEDAEIPARFGYTFKGYQDGEGVEYFKEDGTTNFERWLEAEGKELFAQWDANKFTVTYNANGGTGEITASTFTYGEQNKLTKNEFEKAGYYFVGWSTTQVADYTYDAVITETYINDEQITENVLYNDSTKTATLYAVWQQESYVLKVQGCEDQIVVMGQEINLVSAGVTTGYKFKEWMLDIGNNCTINNPTSETEATIIIGDAGENGAEIVVSASTEIEKYKIVIVSEGNGSAAIKNNETWVAAIENAPYNNMYDIKAEANIGYEFDRWEVTGATITANKAETSITVSDAGENGATITVKAYFKAKEFTVTYNANGGTGDMTASTFTYDAENKLAEKAFERTGYTFIGWSTSAAGTVEYANNENIANALYNDGAGATLYAVWQANTFTVIYNVNGGEGTMSSSTFTYDAENKLAEKVFERTGYTFIGWSTSAAGSVEYSNNEDIENNLYNGGAGATLYAVWQQESYVLKVQGCEDQIVVIGQEINLVSAGVTTGYKFNEWKLDAGDNCIINNRTSETGATITIGDAGENGAEIVVSASTEIEKYKIVIIHEGKGSAKIKDNETWVIEIENVPYNNMYDIKAEANIGYEFDRWEVTGATITANEAETRITVSDAGENGATITVKAYFKAKEFTVTYNANGGEGTMSSSIFTYDAENKLTANSFTKTGYTFIGWSTTPVVDYKYNASIDESSYYASAESTINVLYNGGAGATLYAVWQADKFTVTYNANGGQGTMDPSNFGYGETNTLAANTFTKTGYTFIGWSTTAEGSKVYNNLANIGNDLYNGGAGATLYAVWEANTFTVIYNANGGTGEMTASTFTYDAENKLTANSFTKTGYTFIGWSIEAVADYKYNASIDESSYYTSDEATNNALYNGGAGATLYAVWQADKFTVTYNANGGEGTMDPSNFGYGETNTLAANTFTKDGRKFAGWATTAEGSKVYNNLANIGNALYNGGAGATLYAVWEADKFKVTYNANGGTGEMTASTFTYDETNNLVANAFTKTGYTFIGWSTSATGTVEYLNNEDIENNLYNGGAGATLYAVWQANTFTVTYNANGGTGEMTASTFTYDAENKLAEKAFERTGYTFIGWSTSATGSVEYVNTENVANALYNGGAGATLYAVWQAKTYTIIFDHAGGTSSVTEKSVTYNAVVTAISVKPTKACYTFEGYYLGNVKYFDANGNYAKVAAGTGLKETVWTGTANVQLTAKWSASKYQLVFNNAGGEGLAGVEVTYNENVSVIANDKLPSRNGYTFLGYYLENDQFFDANGIFTKFESGKWEATRGYELTAKWQLVDYTITLNFVGGNEEDKPENVLTYNIGSGTQKFELPNTTKENFEFNGWCTDESTSNIGVTVSEENGKYYLNIPAYSFGNVVLKAKFWQSFGALSSNWKSVLSPSQILSTTSINFVSNKIVGTINLNNLEAVGDVSAANINGDVWKEDSGTYPVKVYFYKNNVYIYCEKEIYLPANSSELFKGFISATSINFNSKVITTGVEDMSRMFEGCLKLNKLSLEDFDTSNVTNMSYLFYNASSAAVENSIYLNTDKVTDMSFMFALDIANEFQNVVSLDISTFNTANVTNMASMFENRAKLRTIYIESSLWSVAKVENSENMFKNCASLVGQDGVKWSDLYLENGNQDPGVGCAGLSGVLTQKPSGDSAEDKKPNYMLWIIIGSSVAGAVLLTALAIGIIGKTKRRPQISSSSEDAIKELDKAEELAKNAQNKAEENKERTSSEVKDIKNASSERSKTDKK